VALIARSLWLFYLPPILAPRAQGRSIPKPSPQTQADASDPSGQRSSAPGFRADWRVARVRRKRRR